MDTRLESPRFPIVKIRWVDSSAPRMGWVRLSEWEWEGTLECESVGYLIAQDSRAKTLASNVTSPLSEEPCQGNGIIVIPTQAIISVEELVTLGSSAPACVAQDRS